jgi:hypothetical protein
VQDTTFPILASIKHLIRIKGLEMADTLHTFDVHTTGGERLSIKATRCSANADTGLVEFFISDDEKDPNWTVFLHGVAAIKRANGAPQIQVVGRILG